MKIEREQDLLTTSADLKQQFDEIRARYEQENAELRDQVQILQNELSCVGVDRDELDDQALALGKARTTAKSLVNSLIGWEYTVRKTREHLEGMVLDDNYAERTLDKLIVDIRQEKRRTARNTKERFKTAQYHTQSTADVKLKRERARMMRKKFAVDYLPKYHQT